MLNLAILKTEKNYFKTFDWVIGTGEYLDNVEEKAKQDITSILNKKILDSKSPEYIFIYQLHEMTGGGGWICYNACKSQSP
jgi:hypothetical protein